MSSTNHSYRDDALLEALVSPVGDQRRMAEAQWLALSPSERLGRLLVSDLVPLAPIVLRREIMKLTDVTQLEQVLVALMHKMFAMKQQQHHYFYCAAEIAGVLAWLDGSASVKAVTMLLSQNPSEVRETTKFF
jgi:hypothetical protein